jgi:hypothetical protein
MPTADLTEHAGIFPHKVASSKHDVTLKLFQADICIHTFCGSCHKTQRLTGLSVRCFLSLGDWNDSRPDS